MSAKQESPMSHQDELTALLYDCILELAYIQCVEIPGDHSQCATAKGKELVELGMKAIGAKDLSFEAGLKFLESKRAR